MSPTHVSCRHTATKAKEEPRCGGKVAPCASSAENPTSNSTRACRGGMLVCGMWDVGWDGAGSPEPIRIRTNPSYKDREPEVGLQRCRRGWSQKEAQSRRGERKKGADGIARERGRRGARRARKEMRPEAAASLSRQKRCSVWRKKMTVVGSLSGAVPKPVNTCGRVCSDEEGNH